MLKATGKAEDSSNFNDFPPRILISITFVFVLWKRLELKYLNDTNISSMHLFTHPILFLLFDVNIPKVLQNFMFQEP